MLNLDTHIFIHALQGTLKPVERRLLGQNPWSISVIVLWELAKLTQLGRISLDINSRDFALALSRIHVWPLSLKICQEVMQLDFRSDPADEIIAGTSIVHKIPLLTRDKTILKSTLVPFAK